MHGRVEMCDFGNLYSSNLFSCSNKNQSLQMFVMGFVTGEIFIKTYALLTELNHFKVEGLRTLNGRVEMCDFGNCIFVEPF